ncbi:response regulator transcription factor [Elizabethkingia miricola]|uniref:response regulator transcription factor n=1 Tax=Elizabethkingia miricola TaxID=172045 RepID=UPI002ACE8E97|nr:response regulator transcription factor [Elizabethkingia miricola]WQM39453.1 response regulator transcription factor [Elizabethkingia miricola]
MRKILIADDHYVVLAGTALILHTNIADVKIDHAYCFREVIEKLTANDYELLLLDIDMPDSLYKSMVGEIKNVRKNLKIMIYTSYTDNQIAIQYINEGADGFLNKQANENEIINAVESMLKDGFYYPKQLVKSLVRKSAHPIEKLSERELEIFHLLTNGNGNWEISNLLNIKATTISTYKARIFEKLEVSNLLELIEIKKTLH